MEPVAVAQLDRDRDRRQALDDRLELGEVVVAGRERGRELEHEARQPAGGVERLEDPQGALDQRLLQLVGEHDPAALGDLARRRAGRAGASRAARAWRESARCTLTANVKSLRA